MDVAVSEFYFRFTAADRTSCDIYHITEFIKRKLINGLRFLLVCDIDKYYEVNVRISIWPGK